jgi:uncharacterized membrane protein
MDLLFGSIFMVIGLFTFFCSFSFVDNTRGFYLFIVGVVLFLIGFMIVPKTPPKPIEIKSNKVINIDSIYLQGYKDGIKDCKNVSH